MKVLRAQWWIPQDRKDALPVAKRVLFLLQHSKKVAFHFLEQVAASLLLRPLAAASPLSVFRLRLASFDSCGKLICSRTAGYQILTLEKDQVCLGSIEMTLCERSEWSVTFAESNRSKTVKSHHHPVLVAHKAVSQAALWVSSKTKVLNPVCGL